MTEMQKRTLLNKDQDLVVWDKRESIGSLEGISLETSSKDTSDTNKENQDNKCIPILAGVDRNCASKHQNVCARGPTVSDRKSPPPVEAGSIRSEHQVVSNSRPMSKPLVLATRVTPVNLSPPPADCRQPPPSASEQNSSWSDNDDSSMETPKVSRLKAFFQGQSPAKEASPQIKASQIKSPRLSRSGASRRSAKSTSDLNNTTGSSDLNSTTGFDNSTAPTGGPGLLCCASEC